MIIASIVAGIVAITITCYVVYGLYRLTAAGSYPSMTRMPPR